jgi:transcriptional regulator with XRE-family HTH domain
MTMGRKLSFDDVEHYSKDPKVLRWVIDRLRIETQSKGRAKEIAVLIEMTQGHLSNVISGKRPPGVSTIARLFDLWGVGVDELKRITRGAA